MKSVKPEVIMKRRKFGLFVIVLHLLYIGCSKDEIPKSKEEILTGTFWRMNSFVDHQNNTGYNIPSHIYKFKKNGIFVVFPENSEPDYSTWELIEKGTYIRIGSNIFKLQKLSPKLIGLRYGSILIFYVPVEGEP